MSGLTDYLHAFNFTSVFVRLLLAFLAGGAIGFGRARKKQNAGLRTFILSSVGAALTVIISMYEYEMLCGQWAAAASFAELKFDGTRFAAQVINGIGFLAAGTIIAVAHQQVSGLTTAIGLFTAACLGIAAGAGFYACVLISVFFIIFTLEFLKPLEVAYKRRLRNITITVEFDSLKDTETIEETIRRQDAQIFDVDIERARREGDLYPSMILTLKLSRQNASHSAILSSVAELPCVHSIQELIS